MRNNSFSGLQPKTPKNIRPLDIYTGRGYGHLRTPKAQLVIK
tara:strand:- start:176 stop:301 length:126 start_codon:yes stop_codon:yes gene_type:complete